MTLWPKSSLDIFALCTCFLKIIKFCQLTFEIQSDSMMRRDSSPSIIHFCSKLCVRITRRKSKPKRCSHSIIWHYLCVSFDVALPPKPNRRETSPGGKIIKLPSSNYLNFTFWCRLLQAQNQVIIFNDSKCHVKTLHDELQTSLVSGKKENDDT